MSRERIICAGFGGQGIMILGKLIAYSAMTQGYNVTWMPSYGAEVRGGTAHCMVTISDEEIASPLLSSCDTAIIMNKPSLDKFLKAVVSESKDKRELVLLNSSLADKDIKKKGLDVIKIPMTELAHELGNVRAANMVALGAYMKRKAFFSKAVAAKGIRIAFAGKKDIIDLNIKALNKGEAFAYVPEGHVHNDMDERPSVQACARQAHPKKKGAANIKPRGSI